MKKTILQGHVMKIILYVLTSMLLVSSFSSCGSSVTVDNSTVKTVDLNRYLGVWYEVARLDHKFERDMTQCSATYSMKNSGKLQIKNRGMKNGKWKTSTAKAKLTDIPGVLRVSFWGPFYSDYRILMLSPDYSYALVGGSSDDYLWFLSRTPQLKTDVRQKLLLEAQRRGYKTNDLIWVEQQETW